MRRLLKHSPDTAGGLMTSEPVVLAPDTTVAEALARVRDPDLTPALASLVFVVRPPTATPTGRYLGCVHLQRLLREPPAALVSGIIDTDLPSLRPEDSLAAVTRYFAAYNLVCGPVVDEENHLLGAVHRRRRARPPAARTTGGSVSEPEPVPADRHDRR